MSNTSKLYYNYMKKLINCCRHSECFHKDYNCNSKAIKAHSIQNNRVLSKLAKNGEVYTFEIDLSKPIIDLKKAIESIDFKMGRVGKKVASTFRGFCQFHDNYIFKPIEEFDFVIGDREQEYLFAYRALSKAYSDHFTTSALNKKLIEMVDDRSIDNLYSIIYTGNISDEIYEGIKDNFVANSEGDFRVNEIIEGMRLIFNKNLDSKKYYKICTEAFEFPVEYNIAVSSMIYLGKDTKGETINDFEKLYYNYKPLFITIFPQSNKTYVLLSYKKNDKYSFKFIKEDILKRPINDIGLILSNIIANKIDNFYYSPVFWDRLDDVTKESFLRQFTSSNISTKSDIDHLNGRINIFK